MLINSLSCYGALWLTTPSRLGNQDLCSKYRKYDQNHTDHSFEFEFSRNQTVRVVEFPKPGSVCNSVEGERARTEKREATREREKERRSNNKERSRERQSEGEKKGDFSPTILVMAPLGWSSQQKAATVIGSRTRRERNRECNLWTHSPGKKQICH